jgi:hypothetical protein
LLIVEGDSDRLGMAGVTPADLLIGWICHMAAGVAAFDGPNSDDVEEHGFGAPEAPARQDCDFLCHVSAPAVSGAK